MKRLSALLGDSMMCSMMYVLQRRHRPPSDTRERAEHYLASLSGKSARDFFALPESGNPNTPPAQDADAFNWSSPVACRFAENARCRALAFPSPQGWKAPTAILLHALMSASDRGYRALAKDFNKRGWNAVFVHLPYHYSRTPKRHLNGELAITADLLRTAEALRAGVVEIRQLMAWLRNHGSSAFGLWACSYGGWIASLLASLEKDFRWIALLEPIADLNDALWRSAAGRGLRRHFRLDGIPESLVDRFKPFICPTTAAPPTSTQNILLAAGTFDRIARPAEIAALHRRWSSSTFVTEPQGHFGFRLARRAWQWLEDNNLLSTRDSAQTPRRQF